MSKDVKFWLEDKGEKCLLKIGLKKGMTVLDFGAGEGNYTIPAAKIVGANGKVIAVDKNNKSLETLSRKVNENGLNNIDIIHNEGKLDLNIADESIDYIILFDVLHEIDDKDILLQEFHRILTNAGILSIYTPHIDNMKEVTENIIAFDFEHENSYEITLLHYEITRGKVEQFVKL